MTTKICIDVFYGADFVTEYDKDRAEEAALAVMAAAGLTPEAAFADYQQSILDDEADLTIEPLDPLDHEPTVWERATDAANVALTEDWYNPAGAACDFSI